MASLDFLLYRSVPLLARGTTVTRGGLRGASHAYRTDGWMRPQHAGHQVAEKGDRPENRRASNPRTAGDKHVLKRDRVRLPIDMRLSKPSRKEEGKDRAGLLPPVDEESGRPFGHT